MNTKPLKLGFVGGAIDSAVGTTHMIASQMDNRWQLCCGCFSKESSVNLRTGELWNIDKSRIYPNWQELLLREKDKIDAISILTPTPSHKEITQACLENDMPVICEKALTSTVKEAFDLKRELQNRNGYLAVTYNYTGYPMIRELKHILQNQRIGKLIQIHIEMPQEGFLRLGKDLSKPVPQEWRLVDGEIPILSLDLAVHIHQMIDFLTGEKPIELVTTNNNFGFFNDIIDNTICISRYTGNLDCQIWFSKSALGYSNGLRLRVFGTSGSAEWFQMDPEIIQISDNLGKKYTLERSAADLEVANEARYNRFKAGHPAGFIEAFANYYYDLADTVLEFKQKGSYSSPWVFGADVAYDGLIMLEAMAKSANNKSWEKIKKV